MKKSEGVNVAVSLESRLQERSDLLEEEHMEAAIDAQLTHVEESPSACVTFSQDIDLDQNSQVVFDDYKNPNSVKNCLSPYVPSKADRILRFIQMTGINKDDKLLDIGCGDGRVCVIASSQTGCAAVGIDVSPLCIKMAKEISKQEKVDNLCDFYQADMTIKPSKLFESVLTESLERCSIVFLYTYPTLLMKLLPLLECLSNKNVFAIGTLTYHIPDANAIISAEDKVHDIRIYSKVKAQKQIII